MRNFRINTGNEQSEERHGYYEPGQSFSFKKIIVGKVERFVMLENSEPTVIQVRIA